MLLDLWGSGFERQAQGTDRGQPWRRRKNRLRRCERSDRLSRPRQVITEAGVETLVPFPKRNAAQRARVDADETAAYASLPTMFDDMQSSAHKHSVNDHAPDQMHTIGMASFWLVLERERRGTFHEISHETPSSACPDSRGQEKCTGHAHANCCSCHGVVRQADRVPSARRRQLAFPAPRDLKFFLDTRAPNLSYGCSG